MHGPGIKFGQLCHTGGNHDTRCKSEQGVWQVGCCGAGRGGHPAPVARCPFSGQTTSEQRRLVRQRVEEVGASLGTATGPSASERIEALRRRVLARVHSPDSTDYEKLSPQGSL
jgi:hypothetical protein